MLSAYEATYKIKRGSRLFLGTGCGEPQYLIKKIVANPSLHDIMVYQMFSGRLSRHVYLFFERFSLKLFFISVATRQAAF